MPLYENVKLEFIQKHIFYLKSVIFRFDLFKNFLKIVFIDR